MNIPLLEVCLYHPLLRQEDRAFNFHSSCIHMQASSIIVLLLTAD